MTFEFIRFDNYKDIRKAMAFCTVELALKELSNITFLQGKDVDLIYLICFYLRKRKKMLSK